MKQGLRYSVVPFALAIAAFIGLLPRTGPAVFVHMVRAHGTWAFAPETLRIAPGARIEFVNDSTTTHTATCQGCSWDTGDVQPGDKRFITFEHAGVFAFACRYHGGSDGMAGSLGVGSDPGAIAPKLSGGATSVPPGDAPVSGPPPGAGQLPSSAP